MTFILFLLPFLASLVSLLSLHCVRECLVQNVPPRCFFSCACYLTGPLSSTGRLVAVHALVDLMLP